MTRDTEVLRAIFISLQLNDDGAPWTLEPLLDKSLEEVVESVSLLQNCGFLEARIPGLSDHKAAVVLRLTERGREFLRANEPHGLSTTPKPSS